MRSASIRLESYIEANITPEDSPIVKAVQQAVRDVTSQGT